MMRFMKFQEWQLNIQCNFKYAPPPPLHICSWAVRVVRATEIFDEPKHLLLLSLSRILLLQRTGTA